MAIPKAMQVQVGYALMCQGTAVAAATYVQDGTQLLASFFAGACIWGGAGLVSQRGK